MIENHQLNASYDGNQQQSHVLDTFRNLTIGVNDHPSLNIQKGLSNLAIEEDEEFFGRTIASVGCTTEKTCYIKKKCSIILEVYKDHQGYMVFIESLKVICAMLSFFCAYMIWTEKKL